MLLLLMACHEPPALSPIAPERPPPAEAPAPQQPPPATPAPPPDYAVLRAQLAERQRDLAARYAAASPADAPTIVQEARAAMLEGLTTSLFPRWEGTPWAFEGIAASPGDEPIACGYFVSTTLQHLGIRLNRYKLAQQAAADIAASLSGPASLRWFRDDEAGALALAGAAPGVWVVGLDFHVGFLWNDGQNTRFCHSNYIDAVGVMCEDAASSEALAASRVHVLSPLFTTDQAQSWLTGETLSIRAGTRPPG